jgi:20S proteasome alpha/beta subunit
MSLAEAKELAAKAMKSAFSRDAMSGNGVDLLIATKEGISEESLRF